MQLPPLLGNLDQSNFFIYAACDVEYFNEFGPSLIRSIQQNTKFGLHLHLYNPLADQIQYCRSQDRVSVTFEYVSLELFDQATEPWRHEFSDPDTAMKYKRILSAMGKGKDPSLQHRIQRTYFACARFIRLQQLIKPTTSVLAIDIDAVVRGNMPELANTHDFYLHHVPGKNARFLAGGIYLTGHSNGYDFLKEYAQALSRNIANDNLYWGLDQDVLDPIVPRYRWAQLPTEYIDWAMRPNSYIWTAKGARKDLAVFINEKQKYIS